MEMLTKDSLEHLRRHTEASLFWRDLLSPASSRRLHERAIHLAVFVEPYLQFILDGKKTVESRFTTRRGAPFGRVHEGDLILLKRSAGPVVGICEIAEVWDYTLGNETWDFLRKRFGQALCMNDSEFWEQRKQAAYATLMKVRRVTAVPPFQVPKRDRRGWVILRERAHAEELPL